MARSDQDELTQDSVFDILSNPRRRYILYHLQEADGAVELGDLSTEIAAWENDVEPDELTAQQRKRVYVSLYQTHVPKMADTDVIEYDQEESTVQLSAGWPTVRQSLGVDESEARNWELYYLGLSIVSALLIAATVLDVGIFQSVSAVTVGVVVTLSFGTLTLAHLFYRRLRHRNQISEWFRPG